MGHLCGIGDGQQFRLFAAMLHGEKVIITRHCIPEDTSEITQVRQHSLAGTGSLPGVFAVVPTAAPGFGAI